MDMQTPDPARTSLVEKVKKLIRLAQRAGTPEEAATAMAKVQELTYKYKLEVSEFEDKQLAEEKIEDGVTVHEGLKTPVWISILLHTIAKANQCTSLLYRPKVKWGIKGKLVLIGTGTNVAVVQFLYAYVKGEIERLVKLALPDKPFYMDGRKFADDFRRGAVAAVARKLSEQQARTKQEYANQPNALMRIDREANKLATYMKIQFPKLNKGRDTSKSMGEGYHKGYAAGSNIDLNRRGIGTQAERKQLV